MADDKLALMAKKQRTLPRPIGRPGLREDDRRSPFFDPDDLTTHGLIVGMTGSGKTALGIVLIEELLKTGVPVLAVDPKGDLGNLLLAFPKLSPEEFAPYVEATAGKSAESEAKSWTEGLAGWGLGPADVAAYAASREAAIYTPGSAAGLPLDLVGSCPPLPPMPTRRTGGTSSPPSLPASSASRESTPIRSGRAS